MGVGLEGADWVGELEASSWMQSLGEGQCPTLAIMGLTVE